MMLPPIVRVGPLPAPRHDTLHLKYAVLTPRGWTIAQWTTFGYLLENGDQGSTAISPDRVLCWMPADGS